MYIHIYVYIYIYIQSLIFNFTIYRKLTYLRRLESKLPSPFSQENITQWILMKRMLSFHYKLLQIY